MPETKKPAIPIKIKMNPENPESSEVLAKAIIEIADGFRRLMAAGLNRRGLVVLIQDYIGGYHVSKKDINLVLDALPELGRVFATRR